MTFDERWAYAAAVIVAGFVVGAGLAALARRLLADKRRRPAVQAIASPTTTFLFWLSVATGIVTAIGFASPETLQPIPSDILSWLPGALAAGLILLAAYAGGSAISAAAGSAIERATKRRPASVERVVRWVVMAAAVVLALGNLGVQTTSLQIVIAATVSSVGLSFALLTALGGKEVAANIASGRTLRTELNVGDHISVGEIEGTIAGLRPAVALIDTAHGQAILPFAILLRQPFHVRPKESSSDPG